MQERVTVGREYSNKVLSASLQILAAKNGLTPTQIQQELAQRGIFATPQYIGRLLSSQSGAVKIGSRWYVFD